MARTAPLIDVRNIVKHFGSVIALSGVSMTVVAGEVHCLLGDNGAGKSTLIKTLSGVHQPTRGRVPGRRPAGGLLLPARRARCRHRHGLPGPRDDPADVASRATSSWAASRTKRRLARSAMSTSSIATRSRARRCSKIGIDVRDPHQAVGTLSGGERQCVAIARAVYFGAKVLILDEPTSALGVAQTSMVLKYIHQVAPEGPRRDLHHPQCPPRLCGGRPLHRAQPRQDARHLHKADINIEELQNLMAGGKELQAVVAAELGGMV